jgi:hypothetical protein
LHSNVDDSEAENAKLAFGEVDGAGGLLVIVVVGAVRSNVTHRGELQAETLPAVSCARASQ